MYKAIRKNYRDFGCAILLQAVKDYFEDGVSHQKRRAILKDLRNNAWLDLVSDGMAPIVAEQLELHPEEIKQRLKGDDIMV